MRTRKSLWLVVPAIAALALSGCASGGAAAPDTEAAAASTKWTVDPAYDGPDAKFFTELTEPAAKSADGLSVGFLQISGAQPVLLAMQNALTARVEELGGTVIVKDAGLDVQKQQSQIEELITQHVDVIVGYPVVGAALQPGIAQAEAAGIPFVAMMTPPDVEQPALSNVVTNVNQAIDYAAWSVMKELADAHPGASFGVMGFAAPVDTLTYISKREIYWGEHFGLSYLGRVDAQSDAPSGYSAAATALISKYPDMDILVTYNDQSALAAQSAAVGAGRTTIVFADPNSGQSIAQSALVAGKLEVVYRTPWEAIGRTAADAAITAVTAPDTKFPLAINVPGTLVTSKTANDIPWVK